MLIANYHQQRQQIGGLAQADCPIRAVLVEGGPDYGKSHLLHCVAPELKANAKVVVVELDKRRIPPEPLEIMQEIAGDLGFDHFPRLDTEIRQVQRRPLQANICGVTVAGTSNTVQAVAEETETDRLVTAVQVTKGFLADLANLPDGLKPLILAFDGYDESMSLIDRWFDNPLILGLGRLDHVRLIICGRVLPPRTVKARVAAPKLEIALAGVTDEQDWLPVIAALKRRIPGEEAPVRIGYLRGLIHAHRGAPGRIMTEIKLFAPDQ